MGYGQYSAGGGLNRTKADMLEIFRAQGYDIDETTARKGGKNRLVFSDRHGRRYFTLHETVVAKLWADGRLLELADGGWHTPTTKSAWGDACAAFGIEWSRWGMMPGRDERAVTFNVVPNPEAGVKKYEWGNSGRPFMIAGRAAEVQPDYPLIRASVDSSEHENVAVRYDGKHITSEAMHDPISAAPKRVLAVLYQIDKLARATHDFSTRRDNVLDQFSFEAFGFTIHPGQTSRTMMIGCHTFKTRDIRATTKQIERLYPDAVKPAKAWVKAHPNDFGVPAYKAEQERLRAEHNARIAARNAEHRASN